MLEVAAAVISALLIAHPVLGSLALLLCLWVACRALRLCNRWALGLPHCGLEDKILVMGTIVVGLGFYVS